MFRNKGVILIVIATIFFIVVSVILQLPANFDQAYFIFPDAQSYQQAADLLYRHQFSAHSIRTFGYPLLLGLPYLFGATEATSLLQWSLVLNIICWCMSGFILHRIAAAIAPRYAFGAVLVFIFTISNITSLYQSITETIFVTLNLLFFWFLLQYYTHRHSRHLLLALFFLCYSVVVRPISLYFAELFLLVCVFVFIRQRAGRPLILALLVFGSTIGLQEVMMHKKYGRFTLSQIQNYTVFAYLIDKAEYLRSDRQQSFGSFTDDFLMQAERKLEVYPPDSKQYWDSANAMYARTIMENLQTNRGNIAVSWFQNVLGNSREGAQVIFFARNRNGSWLFAPAQRLASVITGWQNRLFSVALLANCAVVFVLFWVSRKKLHAQLMVFTIMAVMMLYFFATAGISFWQGDRFNFILYPFISIIALFNITEVKKVRRLK